MHATNRHEAHRPTDEPLRTSASGPMTSNALGVSALGGLTTYEAEERLQNYGPNVIAEDRPKNRQLVSAQVLGCGALDARGEP